MAEHAVDAGSVMWSFTISEPSVTLTLGDESLSKLTQKEKNELLVVSPDDSKLRLAL